MDVSRIVRNFSLYATGVGFAVVGALGLSGAIELSLLIAGVFFVVGLGLVLVVHELYSGPI